MENQHSLVSMEQTSANKISVFSSEQNFLQMDIRSLYEKSRRLISSLQQLKTQKLSQNQTNQQKDDLKLTRSFKLCSILKVLIRRLNSLTNKQSPKVFIALFSNFCYIYPFIDSMDFSDSFTNRVYRKIRKTLSVCYQEWRKGQKSSQQNILLLRFATLLSTISKLGKDSIKLNKMEIFDSKKILNIQLLKVLFSMRLGNCQKIVIPYLQIINLILNSANSSQKSKILAQIGPSNILDNIFHNMIAKSQKIQHRIEFTYLCLLVDVLKNNKNLCVPKFQQLSKQLIFDNQQKSQLTQFCLNTIQYYCSLTTNDQLNYLIIKKTVFLLGLASQQGFIDENFRNSTFSWFQNLVLHPYYYKFADEESTKIFIQSINEEQNEILLKSVFYKMTINFKQIQQQLYQPHQQTLQMIDQRFKLNYKTNIQYLRIVYSCLKRVNHKNLLRILSSLRQFEMIQQNIQPTYYFWNILNQMFNAFLNFQRGYLLAALLKTNFQLIILIMQFILSSLKQIPEIIYTLKTQFCYHHLNQIEQNKYESTLKRILLQYKVIQLQAEIYKQKHNTTHPHLIQLQANILYLRISDFFSSTNLLENYVTLKQKWGKVLGIQTCEKQMHFY